MSATRPPLMMAVTVPPLVPADLAPEISTLGERIDDIRRATPPLKHIPAESSKDEVPNWRYGTLRLSRRFISTYHLVNNELYLCVFLPPSANPFLGGVLCTNAVNFLKQLHKGKDIPTQLVDKRFFDVQWGLTRILEGMDISAVDLEKSKSIVEFSAELDSKMGGLQCKHLLSECNSESRTCRQAGFYPSELMIEIGDLGTDNSIPILDSSCVLNEVKDFVASRPSERCVIGKPTLDSFDDEFNFDLVFPGSSQTKRGSLLTDS